MDRRVAIYAETEEDGSGSASTSSGEGGPARAASTGRVSATI